MELKSRNKVLNKVSFLFPNVSWRNLEIPPEFLLPRDSRGRRGTWCSCEPLPPDPKLPSVYVSDVALKQVGDDVLKNAASNFKSSLWKVWNFNERRNTIIGKYM